MHFCSNCTIITDISGILGSANDTFISQILKNEIRNIKIVIECHTQKGFITTMEHFLPIMSTRQ